MPRQLAHRHREFLKYYLAEGDAAKAYRAAGFVTKWPAQQAQKLLRRPAIQAELRQMRALVAQEMGATVTWCVDRWRALLAKAEAEGDLDVHARVLENLSRIARAYDKADEQPEPRESARELAAQLVAHVMQAITPVLSRHGLPVEPVRKALESRFATNDAETPVRADSAHARRTLN